uniref:PAS domain-containing protein n=1 Tax=Aliarcobacter cibarius TaxID=255507 RepID=UPI000E5CFC1F
QKLSHIGLWEYDLKTNVLSWTDEVYNIFELDKNIFTPTYENFLKIIHPDDKKVVEDAYLKSIKNQTVYKQIHRLLMNDGRVKWVKDECVTQFDEKGVALYSKGAVQDITELTLAKLKAENEHDKLKAVFDNAPDLLWIKDPKGVYISCNKRFEELYGAKEKDIVNKTDYDFVDKELVSPEYNFSVSPVLVNTIAWVSRIGDDFRKLFDSRAIQLATHSGGNGVDLLNGLRVQFTKLGANVMTKEILTTYQNKCDDVTLENIFVEFINNIKK